ncbi:uncharacterized protein LOC124788732 [Schistocerca piceifrons]|uniref:uncharacterized protein LOC124788732 n=1 Tax=Schistocerca piceifrons TaxID=274613 RepID=UPI001F5E5672|nr:uncharacterized protein LOC124788732 [Schistocerca piceifrons]
MRYIDICSLYPTVMFYDTYPVGHPLEIFKPEQYNKEWFGLVKCKVLAPKGLYHPVLPIKQEKLVFALCVRCAEEKVGHCNHTDEERAFAGTWSTVELNKAIEKGYKILETYEVWHFPQTSNDLFKDYIKTFMKIKLETSPWEDDYGSKEEYVKAIKDKQGIELDIDRIEPNPGKRAVAKICLNSLWGKFGQRQNLTQNEFISDPQRWYELLLDDKIEISNVIFINEDMIEVSYKYTDEYIEDSTATNIFIAAFTTSNVRIRLYEMLDRLGDKVVYYDTDSVVYIDDGTNKVETGCMLGKWTDELGKDDTIIEWLSTDPKSYAYYSHKGSQCTEVKGFSLNYENSLKINMKTIADLVHGKSDNITTNNKMITRNKKTKNLVNKGVEKEFKVTYDKRMVLKETDGIIDTLPWGY